MTRYFLMYLLVVSIAVLGGCNDSKQLAAKDVLDVFQENIQGVKKNIG